MRKEKATEKIRPCVVMEDDADPTSLRKSRKICLATRWDKTPLANLPKLFRYFSVPIFPNSCDGYDTYHSLPVWSVKDAFLIAWVFPTKRPLINRWPKKVPGDAPEQTWVFGQRAKAKLDDDCFDKRGDWIAQCQANPKFAEEHARECLVS
ncbi:hypothetical protein L226DRAFT_176371 [Lentinus tigrinus ALCF2SS1-7]|uniref:uncharacterized protein n=1 Tax=Lentinus tigrinus ALCF2SS1-7 TaxID=1328758 RepID=UPI00116635A7|nr:hypothetical protein L226DRAFT_176371 [Lentinus tigrinus ALCF2SS1-7]